MGKKKVISGALVCSFLLLSLLFSSAASAERRDISVDEAYQMLQENPDEIILLDVRTEMEYASEHIKGALNIPLAVLESRLDELDRSKIIIVYCLTGSRTRRAGDILVQHGFERIYEVVGGIKAWREKYPTSLTTPPPTKMPTGAIEAPPFTLTSIDGATFSLSDYRGKVIVLTLVATTCGDCNREMPELVQLRQEYPDVVMITVSIDPTDTDEILRSFKEKYNADWVFARDTDNVFRKYQGYRAATPTINIITPQGYISFRKVEVVPLEDLKSAVESAYSEEGELIPTPTSEEKPKIPGFEVTSTIAMLGVLTVSLWMVRRKKK